MSKTKEEVRADLKAKAEVMYEAMKNADISGISIIIEDEANGMTGREISSTDALKAARTLICSDLFSPSERAKAVALLTLEAIDYDESRHETITAE